LLELANGRWQPVIDDESARERPEAIRRLVLCSGKVYVDLASDEARTDARHVAVVRVEQLYPFPGGEIQTVLTSYPNLAEVVWLQEEPENMGAWSFVRPRLLELIDGRWPLRYVGRAANSSPAEGSSTWHAANQSALVDQALGTEIAKPDVITAGHNGGVPTAG
jgi:2-oxoglutarate dehydrogenase E1 component